MQGKAIRLRGAHVEETTRALITRLTELGRQVERIGNEEGFRLGSASGFICRQLADQGALVVVTCGCMQVDCDCLAFTIDAHDTPEFAAEKILDDLAAEGLVSLEAHTATPEEEELIRKRLSDLGYIE